MREINLLQNNPVPERRIEKGWRTIKNKVIGKKFGFDFFDGDRINGYGGYYYDGRWVEVAKKLVQLYDIKPGDSVLDIGCGKCFLMHDLQEIVRGVRVAGIDISEYAINKAMDRYGEFVLNNDKNERRNADEIEREARRKVLPHAMIGSADKLPWPDKSFDVVLSINTAHNLPLNECQTAIKEMLRVGRDKRKMFIQLDSFRNEAEKERMDNWAITAETTMYDNEWIDFMKEAGYDGDYFWTII